MESSDDVFFHSDDLNISVISEGDTVLFDWEQASKGPQATRLEVVTSESEIKFTKETSGSSDTEIY